MAFVAAGCGHVPLNGDYKFMMHWSYLCLLARIAKLTSMFKGSLNTNCCRTGRNCCCLCVLLVDFLIFGTGCWNVRAFGLGASEIVRWCSEHISNPLCLASLWVLPHYLKWTMSFGSHACILLILKRWKRIFILIWDLDFTLQALL